MFQVWGANFLLMFSCIQIFFISPFVWSLGENGNFTELLNEVAETISNAQQYIIPKDNSDLLKLNNNEVKEFGTYDFIVIGAGAAGAIIANRLSEISTWNVLLLEAGGQDNDTTKILGLASSFLRTDYSWGYNTTEQKNACQGMVNKRCLLGLGKVLGGGTTINAAIYARGHPEDYNRWVDVYGNPGWSYEEVLPYFRKSENAQFSPRDYNYHSKDGYFTISHTSKTPGLEPVIISGFEEQGLNLTDYNGEFSNGISPIQFALKGNERVSTASAFLRNFTDRKNLHVSVRSLVTRVLMENNEAYGVEFVKNGQTYFARASKEVIVSAGAVNSPQILMLSGIGPKEHLEELSIPVKKDLPVGKNLQDHVMFLGCFLRSSKKLYNVSFVEKLRRYVEHLRPLTAGLSAEMIGFKNFLGNQNERATVEFLFNVPAASKDEAQLTFFLNENYTAAYNTNPETDIGAYAVLLHPKSRGTVTLKSNDPRDKPNIDPNYLAVAEDIEMLYQGIQFFIELNNTRAFRDYGLEILVFDYPGCEKFGKITKDWWICGLRHLATSIYHPACTNRMGPDPETSVVNEKLQVHGIRALRVADASILPELISGHTMAPVMMVGEKVSDIIKQDYRDMM